MEIVILDTDTQVIQYAAGILKEQILAKPNSILGLATGATPEGLYAELIKMHKEENLSLKEITSFNLDEYRGLDANHKASYSHYMHEKLFNHVDIQAQNINIPDGQAADVEKFCEAYEQRIQELGGIDLQILGIGSKGHIGFNEISSSLTSRTRIKTLTQQTRKDNEKYFSDKSEIPKHVITMGIGTIMDSKHCLMLAFGERKAEAVSKMIEGPVTAMLPASILQMHPKCTVVLDSAAASKLAEKEYYLDVYSNKP